ncbi:MAG: hypothetical protein QOG65_2393 [Actinomycetota bacterium]|jgi:hypothetical protein|nr:hypothetical protein [Actinomycetota bacterium]MDQ1385014.1 hypothetical protein [Actinomycetota bacterium]
MSDEVPFVAPHSSSHRTLHKVPLRSTRADPRYATRDDGTAFCQQTGSKSFRAAGIRAAGASASNMAGVSIA